MWTEVSLGRGIRQTLPDGFMMHHLFLEVDFYVPLVGQVLSVHEQQVHLVHEMLKK